MFVDKQSIRWVTRKINKSPSSIHQPTQGEREREGGARK
jgi:hypothetical protein